MSHTGEVTVDGESAVELSDEEVDILVRLIRENKTTDVEELDLENLYPVIYDKLDTACYDMEYNAEEMHWLMERLPFPVFRLRCGRAYGLLQGEAWLHL